MIEFFKAFEGIMGSLSVIELAGGVIPEILENIIVLYSIAFAIYGVLFSLQGLGLYQLAKQAGRTDSWKAFVPFFNSYLFGELAGECRFVSFNIKHPSLFLAISEAVTCIAYVLSEIAQIVLEPFIVIIDQTYTYVGYDIAGLKWAYDLRVAMDYLMPIIELFYIFFFILVVMSFFRKYAARNASIFSIASVFVYFVKPLAIFAVRSNKPIDYMQYIRAQREEYFRRQQQYYGGNPYANPYFDPYNNGGYRGASQSNCSYEEDDPFREFSSRPKTEENRNVRSDISEKDRKENDDFFGV